MSRGSRSDGASTDLTGRVRHDGVDLLREIGGRLEGVTECAVGDDMIA